MSSLQKNKDTFVHAGFVSKINSDSIIVTLEQNIHCEACHVKGTCGVSESSTKEIEVLNSGDLFKINEHVDVILKGTRVDGIYNTDPEKDASAVQFDFISFEDVLKKGLNVMDTTAFTLSQENKLPIVVFDMNKQGNFLSVCQGNNVGTTVS